MMCLPARFLPLKATCQPSVGPFASGTNPMPKGTAPVDHALAKDVRSSVNAAAFASYFNAALVAQSTDGGLEVEPCVPSGTGLVARQALMCGVAAAVVPAAGSVATGSVIVPPVTLAPTGRLSRSGST